MKIILGISSSISAYKAPSLVRLLKKRGADVFCVLTKNAENLVGIKALETVSGNRVVRNIFDEKDTLTHINLTKEASVFLIAPATANVIGKISNGIADDAISTMAMAFTGKKYIAPAMNGNMWRNEALQNNVRYMSEEMDWVFIGPTEGALACEDNDTGRLSDLEDIVRAVFHTSKTLEGKKIVITAGSTIEWLDDIRFIANRSSGKMGSALASEAILMGAEVVYIKGKTQVAPPSGVILKSVETTKEMENAVINYSKDADAVIMAAAPLDFRPVNRHFGKIKKSDITSISLVENADILKRLRNESDVITVAFAAESENMEENAEKKMLAKGADMLVANEIKDSFGKDDNIITIMSKDGEKERFAKMSKQQCALEILKKLATLISTL